MKRAIRLKVGLLLLLAQLVLPNSGQGEEDTEVRLTYVPNWAPIPNNQGMKWFENKSWMPSTFQSQQAVGIMTIHKGGSIAFEKNSRPWSYRVLAEMPDFVLLFMRMDHTYPGDKNDDIRYTFVILAPYVSEIIGTRDKLPPDFRPLSMHSFYCFGNYSPPHSDGMDEYRTREEHWNMPKNELLAFWHRNKLCNPVAMHADSKELAKYFPNRPAPNWGWDFYSEL
ncbi:MAG: hypothetical protein OEL53_09640 [Rhodospirillales bacterium]|nr:hypothetical protein [Rhodospirillales bacterium]